MKTLKELNFITLCFLYLFGLSMFTAQYLFSNTRTVHAITSIMATLIGGTTNGVSDICCNGVVLDFDSISPMNMSILDGEAIFVPIVSRSYDNGNEYSSGYNVIGNLMPGVCVQVEAECESVESMPVIRNIGTSGMPSSF